MNIERLNKILVEIDTDYSDLELLTALQNVSDSLQNQIGSPSHPQYQDDLVKYLKELYALLDESITNNFGPYWMQVLYEIGGKDLFGSELKFRLQTTFAANQITPASALEDISAILEKSKAFKNAIDDILSGFKSFSIGKDELAPGECELGYMIPRLYVKNKLNSLNKEISELNFILNAFSEAVTGEKQDFEVRTIASSDFLLYVMVTLGVGKVLAEVVERITNNYKTILDIRKLRNELRDHGVPAKDTKAIEQYANTKMEDEIAKIVQDIFKSYKKTDAARENEIKNAVTIALNKIANRIDYGFNIDIRVRPLKRGDTDANPVDVELINAIKEKTKSMVFMNTSGQQILQLSEQFDLKPPKSKGQ